MAMAKAASHLGTATNLAVRNPITRLLCNSIRRHNKEASANTEFQHLSFTEDLKAEESLKSLFERWRCHYDVGPDWDLSELNNRFSVFKDNVKLIHEVNNEKQSNYLFTLGLNKFTAMTDEEFQEHLLY